MQEEDLLGCWKQFVLHPGVAEHQVEADFLVVALTLVGEESFLAVVVDYLVVALCQEEVGAEQDLASVYHQTHWVMCWLMQIIDGL